MNKQLSLKIQEAREITNANPGKKAWVLVKGRLSACHSVDFLVKDKVLDGWCIVATYCNGHPIGINDDILDDIL